MWLGEEDCVDHLLSIVGGPRYDVCHYLSLSLIVISWVQPHTIRDVLMEWRRRLNKSWVLEVWKLMPLASL